MDQCSKLTKGVKLEIVQRYLQGESSGRLGKIYGFHQGSLRDWIKKYQKNGIGVSVSAHLLLCID